MHKEDMHQKVLQEANMLYMVLQLVAELDTQDISPGMFIVQDRTCHQMKA